MATTFITVDCKLFQMIPYIIILHLRKFHQPITDRFSKEKNLWGGGGGTIELKFSYKETYME